MKKYVKHLVQCWIYWRTQQIVVTMVNTITVIIVKQNQTRKVLCRVGSQKLFVKWVNKELRLALSKEHSLKCIHTMFFQN